MYLSRNILVLLAISLAWASSGFAASAKAPKDQKLCDRVFIRGDASIRFSENERGMICGFPKSKSWAEIPFNQVKLFITPFLQERAYHEPTFQIESENLIILPGPRTIVRSVIKKDPKVSYPNLDKRRFLTGEPLTPSYLDQLETWAPFELQKRLTPVQKFRHRLLSLPEMSICIFTKGRPMSILR